MIVSKKKYSLMNLKLAHSKKMSFKKQNYRQVRSGYKTGIVYTILKKNFRKIKNQ